MLMREDFCVFILTHGRPDGVHSYKSLIRTGYTGKVYLVIDDEDKTADEYRRIYGDKVLQFCKAEWAEKTDEGDNFNHRKAVVYARNACWELAKQVGCRYFVQFDDDYVSYQIRHNSAGEYVTGYVTKGMDAIIEAMLDFYIAVPQAMSVAMAQGGDHIGGGKPAPKLTRKCMNSWFCDVERPIQFFGHMNEDVSAYVTYGHRGQLFLTAVQMMIVPVATQAAQGGMTDVYLSNGTYTKSFYTIMANPSCVQIGMMGRTEYRIHHKINWHKAVPKIIDETHRKARV
jgi:hypothetical protein